MRSTFAIHCLRTLTPEGMTEATVLIEKGKIKAVYRGPAPELDCRVEEMGNLVLMPGIVDVHVHINEPGRTHWEGFDSATRAAAAGGVTTLVDMPLNSTPVTTSASAFQAKLEAAKDKLHVNCGFWGGIVPGSHKKLAELLESGVLGIKAFLTHSGIDDFPNATENDLRRAMPLIAESKLPLLVHCELESPHPGLLRLAEQPHSYVAWLQSRPANWENQAISLMIQLCKETNCRTHIVHLSSSEALPLIREAKKQSLPLTVETCPHYLYFASEQLPDSDTRFKCAPPIRGRTNNELLWKALENGDIDLVSSDHSPAPPEIKYLEQGRLDRAWGGIAGLQFSLPAFWSVAKNRGWPLVHLTKIFCEKPAKFIGLGEKKGKIAPNYDADLVVWNPDQAFLVTEAMIQHRHKITPYLSEQLFGVVKHTYVNGNKVFTEGDFTRLNQGELLLYSKSL